MLSWASFLLKRLLSQEKVADVTGLFESDLLNNQAVKGTGRES